MKIYLAGVMSGGAQNIVRKQYEDMKVFLAGGQGQLASAIQSTANQAESGGAIFNGANILQSFYYVDDFTENIIIPNCKDFMLDSGAFTFMQSSKKQINWDEYVERYAQFVKKNRIEKYFEEIFLF